MKGILSRWYISGLLIPVGINLLTDYFGLPVLLKNWTHTIIAVLFILILILIFELHESKKQANYSFCDSQQEPKSQTTSNSYQLNKTDKEIIQNLLDKLDIRSIEKAILENDIVSYNQVKQKANPFIKEAGYIANLTGNKELNKLIGEVARALNDFLKLSLSEIVNIPSNPEKITAMNKNGEFKVMHKTSALLLVKIMALMDYVKGHKYID